jgi:hypothetical protein
MAIRQGNRIGWLGPKDRLLAAGEAPPLAAHIVTPRLGYSHHGIYVGEGLVVQYCEHFCEWCVRGEHRSYQIDERLARCGSGWRRVIEIIARTRLPAMLTSQSCPSHKAQGLRP